MIPSSKQLDDIINQDKDVIFELYDLKINKDTMATSSKKFPAHMTNLQSIIMGDDSEYVSTWRHDEKPSKDSPHPSTPLSSFKGSSNIALSSRFIPRDMGSIKSGSTMETRIPVIEYSSKIYSMHFLV